MTSIKLNKRTWALGARIGEPSGFGKVFEATADDGSTGVVKLIPKQPGAERELLFEDLSGIEYVVPIIDTGEWKNSWALAMPRADRSLRAHMGNYGGPLAIADALPILLDIARALAQIQGRVVHRDLKPENVLLLEGRWCLADFGIARYAEASTDLDTRKLAMTPHYTAPERWRFERATSAADVYSFGIIAWEALMGRLPFPGPRMEDYRDQHLHMTIPEMSGIPQTLSSLFNECLYKALSARPSPQNVIARLERSSRTPSPAAELLQVANREVVDQQAKEQTEASRASSEAARRSELFQAADSSLKTISALVRRTVLENAPAASPDPHSSADDWALRLGDAVIGMDPAQRTSPSSFGSYVPSFDVIAYGAIAVQITPGRDEYSGRSHSLWFGDLQEEGVYRWFETGFMVSAIIPRRLRHVPAAMEPGEKTGMAFWSGMAEWSLARPVVPIDQGEEDAFVERWIEWFGQAASGQLCSPRSLPEGSPSGSYR